MGKLLSLLARDNTSDCCGPKSSYDIFLDFENAQPSENELEVYQEINQVLLQSDTILEQIQVYKVSCVPSFTGLFRHLKNLEATQDKNDSRCKIKRWRKGHWTKLHSN